MPQFTEKSFVNIMSGRRELQHLKALEREPQGTLAFRSYLLKRCRVIPHNKAFGALKLNIPLPPLPEQRHIAEILSAVDRKLELERRRKEKLERVKKGLMNELLTGRKRVN
ncbi:MAG TPA: restriction endonuclease subunit S [Candidatus Methanoperedens sp.]|nr:restriction endonuclease subunit S [Candidatus Methanoperedens sp.]HLB69415.1 restriction endonuclease subunit S [Candidatus Methanoperedens sp.]